MKKTMTVVATLTAACWLSNASAQAPKPADKPAEKPAAPAAAKPADAVKAAAGAAGAAAAAAMTPPKPAPENEIIKKSVGNWSCEGTAKGPDGQEMKYKSSWAIKPILGGHWYSIVYKRGKMGPMPAFEGNGTVGWSVADKKYWLVGVDSFAGWINLSSPDGYVFTGEGTPMNKRTPAKFTFAAGKDKKGQESDKLFDVTLDFGIATSNENCKK